MLLSALLKDKGDCKELSACLCTPTPKHESATSLQGLWLSTVSSQKFTLQLDKPRASNPRAIAYVHFNMPFESTHLQGAGPDFPDRTFKSWPHLDIEDRPPTPRPRRPGPTTSQRRRPFAARVAPCGDVWHRGRAGLSLLLLLLMILLVVQRGFYGYVWDYTCVMDALHHVFD